jgi:hypothetical protein
MKTTDDQLLALYVKRENQRIAAEHSWPKVAAAITEQRDAVVAAWPNVSVMGVPYDKGGKEIMEKML